MENNYSYNEETDYNETDYNETDYNETDYEDSVDDIEMDTYDSEEVSLTKYNIVICEKYNERIHGPPFDNNIKHHYLTHIRFKNLDREIFNILLPRHRLEIAECIYLPNSYYCVSILKTFWIKLIQRKWRKICSIRKSIMVIRSQLSSLKYKEVHGKWPPNCINYPCLKGMLSYL